MKISFGTDGWRGVISREVTFENVEKVAQGYASYLLDRRIWDKGVIVGYDTRFLSDEYARTISQVLSANGIPVLLTGKPTATPVVSYSVKNLGLAGGLVVTASHNPPWYNGIKIKGGYGGSATPELTRDVCSFINKIPVKLGKHPESIRIYDADEAYIKHIKEFVSIEAIKNSGLKFVIDPMYGAGSGYLKNLLEDLGLTVSEIHGEYNPGFAGLNPEPVEENAGELMKVVAAGDYSAGFATDGDADRVGAVDAGGAFINAQEIFAIILWHYFKRGKAVGAVGKTFSTTKMIDKLAERFGLKVWETPIGFKHLIPLFIQGKIFMGGEESGGIGLKDHLPERDGILNSLILMEAMALSKKSLKEIVRVIWDLVGPHYYHRKDLLLEHKDAAEIVRFIKDFGVKDMDEGGSSKLEELDGLKILFNPSRWLLLRPSGTEPVIRIYAEAESEELVNKLLSAGEAMVRAVS